MEKIIGGLDHHYGGNGYGYANMSIQLIEGVEQGNQKALCECEIFWQNQLRVYVQNGGNAHCYRKEKKKWLHNTEPLCMLAMRLNNTFSMEQLCYLFGMEVIFNLLRWPLEDRVDNGTVDLTETSPHYAVI